MYSRRFHRRAAPTGGCCSCWMIVFHRSPEASRGNIKSDSLSLSASALSASALSASSTILRPSICNPVCRQPRFRFSSSFCEIFCSRGGGGGGDLALPSTRPWSVRRCWTPPWIPPSRLSHLLRGRRCPRWQRLRRQCLVVTSEVLSQLCSPLPRVKRARSFR